MKIHVGFLVNDHLCGIDIPFVVAIGKDDSFTGANNPPPEAPLDFCTSAKQPVTRHIRLRGEVYEALSLNGARKGAVDSKIADIDVRAALRAEA
ncbi:MAG: hypothetical protein RLZZ399_160 [Verrucomicrobiota bacterium]